MSQEMWRTFGRQVVAMGTIHPFIANIERIMNDIAKRRKLRLSSASQSRKRGKKKGANYQVLEPRQLLAAAPIITEFLASNDDGLVNDNGDSSDWIEIYNAGDMAVNLAGYTLTDDPTEEDKWAFPSVNLAAGQYLVVFADDDANPGSGTDLYTGFKLKAAGEYIGLYDPSGAGCL